MNIRILLLLPLLLGVSVNGWAAPGECSGPKNDRPDECDGGETTTEYKAELTVGGFIFGRAVVVTPNKRGNAYQSQEDVDMSRPLDGPGQYAWDTVFSTCLELLSGDIAGVMAGDNWTINISGSKVDGSVSNNSDSDILIRFRDVVADDFPNVEIDFNLIGKIGFTNGNNGNVTNFLPELGQTSVFILDTFNFFGSGNRGGGCRSGITVLMPNSVLEIKHLLRPDVE